MLPVLCHKALPPGHLATLLSSSGLQSIAWHTLANSRQLALLLLACAVLRGSPLKLASSPLLSVLTYQALIYT